MRAFDRFYRRHRELVLGYCAQRAGNPEAAADVMAESFAKALAAVLDHERELPASPIAWLMLITQRTLIDSFRRGRVEAQARRRLGIRELVLGDGDLERVIEIADRVDVAVELAKELPADQVAALQARILDEREYEDIAGELACSEAVVRKRVNRALQSLRNAMGVAK